MATEHGFDRAALARALRAARPQPAVIAAMDRPMLEPPKWFEYAPPFLSPARVDGGVAFLAAHRATLQRAERDYGVPPEVVVAIIGVESFYGREHGRHRTFDALATLAFDYPRRATFFRGELEHFLLLRASSASDPLAPRGSFAGAIGMPQFMPGSYRTFAVDFDDDGRIDLWRSADDVIGSVANLPRAPRLAARAADAAAGERRPATAARSCCAGSRREPGCRSGARWKRGPRTASRSPRRRTSPPSRSAC